ncbi:MAG: SUMF1/EgtB/PvdO family nonheme iron enzyme, partial [Planctomycetota bacterium]
REPRTDGMVLIQGATYHHWLPPKNLCQTGGKGNVESFYIDKYETSNREYREFLVARNLKAPRLWPADWRDNWNTDWDDLPVVDVSLPEARAYAEWAGKRLITHHEWELAARGVEGWLLPWQADLENTPMHANVTSTEAPRGTPSEVWSIYLRNVRAVQDPRGDETREGVAHMLGNVVEMTDTILTTSGVDPMARVQKGLAWHLQDFGIAVRLSANGMFGASRLHSSPWRGIRCAKSID